MTDAWLFRFHTSISRVVTDNIVMWETLRQGADWVCFQILFARETWKTQHQHQEERCVSLEVTRLYEAEIISLDAGLRLERTLALNFCGTW